MANTVAALVKCMPPRVHGNCGRLDMIRNACTPRKMIYLLGSGSPHWPQTAFIQSRSINIGNGIDASTKIIQSKVKMNNTGHLSFRTAKTARKEIVESTPGQQKAVTVGEKVKQAGKDATYTGIVILGIGVTAVMFFAVGRELFSGDSPNGVYTRAFKMCKRNGELIDAIGEPMKGYGELTRRGRRRHTSHTEYEVEGQKIMRMKFYVEGPLNKGTAQLEVRKDGGKYQFRYLFVTIDAYPHQVIIIEDNR